MDSDEDRCKIVLVTFRIFPELVTQKVYDIASFADGVYPLVAFLWEWPEGGTIPIELLDRVDTTPLDLGNIYLFDHLSYIRNKDEVTMWAIRLNFELEDVESAIVNSFSVEVVMAAAEAVVAAPETYDVACLCWETLYGA